MAWNQPPQSPQQPLTAPTQPGVAPQQVLSPQQQGAQQPMSAFEQPHPTVQYGQNIPPQTPPAPPVAQQQPTVFGQNTILDGPDVPAELRGRTFGQAMRIYGALANDWLSRQNGAPIETPSQSQSQPQPQFQSQPQSQTARPPQEPVPAAEFFRNPESFIERAATRAVERVVRPVLQQSRKSAIEEARDQAKSMIPDWSQLEGDILETVGTSTPEALANPDYWISAADLARGRNMRTRNPNQPQFASPPTGIPSVPATSYNFQQPVAPSFFTEGPSAPSVYGSTPMGVLTPKEQQAAAAMGMTLEQYAAWKGGVSRGR